MDATMVSALSGLAGVVVTSVVSVIVAKVNSKKDRTINDRQQLSQDQQQFYDMVMKQVHDLQGRADILEQEVTKWRSQAVQLGLENTDLRNKVKQLETRLEGRG